jgi:hypothetical protein
MSVFLLALCLSDPTEYPVPVYSEPIVNLVDITCGLLGPDSCCVDGANFRYVYSSRIPIIFVFTNKNEFYSLSFSPSILTALSTKPRSNRLQGTWLAVGVDLFPDAGVVSKLQKFALVIRDDLFVVDYSYFKACFFHKTSIYGPFVQVKAWFPEPQDVQDISRIPGYSGYFDQYFFAFGDIALFYMPMSYAKCGRMGLCFKLP